MIASTSETFVFLVLGIELVNNVGKGWNLGFVLLCILFTLVYRFIGVLLLR